MDHRVAPLPSFSASFGCNGRRNNVTQRGKVDVSNFPINDVAVLEL